MGTMLKEGDSSTPTSLRRVLALYFGIAAIPLFGAAFLLIAKVSAITTSTFWWALLIPGALCIAAALVLLLFTTWEAISSLISSAKSH